MIVIDERESVTSSCKWRTAHRFFRLIASVFMFDGRPTMESNQDPLRCGAQEAVINGDGWSLSSFLKLVLNKKVLLYFCSFEYIFVRRLICTKNFLLSKT